MGPIYVIGPYEDSTSPNHFLQFTPCDIGQTENSQPVLHHTDASQDMFPESSALPTPWTSDHQTAERLAFDAFQVGQTVPSVLNTQDVDVLCQSEIFYSPLREHTLIQQKPNAISQPPIVSFSTHGLQQSTPSVNGGLPLSNVILPVLIPLQTPVQSTNQLVNDVNNVIRHRKSLTPKDEIVHGQGKDIVADSHQYNLRSEPTQSDEEVTAESVQVQGRSSDCIPLFNTSQSEHPGNCDQGSIAIASEELTSYLSPTNATQSEELMAYLSPTDAKQTEELTAFKASTDAIQTEELTAYISPTNATQSEEFTSYSSPTNGTQSEERTVYTSPTNATQSEELTSYSSPTDATQSEELTSYSSPTNATQSEDLTSYSSPTNATQSEDRTVYTSPTNATQNEEFTSYSSPTNGKQSEELMAYVSTNDAIKTEERTAYTSPTNAVQFSELTAHTSPTYTSHTDTPVTDSDVLEKRVAPPDDVSTYSCQPPSLPSLSKLDCIPSLDETKLTPPYPEGLPSLSKDSIANTNPTFFKSFDISLRDVLLVFASFIINMFPMGLGNSYGIFYTHLTSTYNFTEYDVSWIASMMTGTAGFGAVAGTPLLTTIGCRWTGVLGGVLMVAGFLISAFTTNINVLYVSMGVLPGFGTAFGQMANLICISRHFKRGRPFALGIAISGGSAGMMLFPILWNLLLECVGWKLTMLAAGGVAFNAVWSSLLLNPPKQHATGNYRELSEEKSTAHAYIILLKNPYFLVHVVSVVFVGISLFIYASYIPEYASRNQPELSSTSIAIAVCAMGAGNFVGKILFPSLSSASPRAPVIAYTVALTLGGVSNGLVPICSTYATLVINSFFQGCIQGGCNSLSTLVCLSVFGKDTLSTSLGLVFLFIGLGCLAGPPSAIALESVTGQMDVLFYIAAGGYIVSALLMLPLFMVKPNSNLDVTVNVKLEDGKGETEGEGRVESGGETKGHCRQEGVEQGEINLAFVEAG